MIKLENENVIIYKEHSLDLWTSFVPTIIVLQNSKVLLKHDNGTHTAFSSLTKTYLQASDQVH